MKDKDVLAAAKTELDALELQQEILYSAIDVAHEYNGAPIAELMKEVDAVYYKILGAKALIKRTEAAIKRKALWDLAQREWDQDLTGQDEEVFEGREP